MNATGASAAIFPDARFPSYAAALRHSLDVPAPASRVSAGKAGAMPAQHGSAGTAPRLYRPVAPGANAHSTPSCPGSDGEPGHCGGGDAPALVDASPAKPATANAQRLALRRAWFAALQEKTSTRHARLSEWLAVDECLFAARQDGRSGLWYAIVHGKTGVLEWMCRQSGFDTFLFAPEQAQCLVELLASFDIDNEDGRIAGLKVLLAHLRHCGDEGRRLLGTITPALVRDLPSTRKLLTTLKLLVPMAEPEPAPTPVTEQDRPPRSAARRTAHRQRLRHAQRDRQRIQTQDESSTLLRGLELAGRVAGMVGSLGQTALMTACIEGDHAQVAAALVSPEEVRRSDAQGRDALMLCAIHGRTDLFLPLLSCGARLSQRCRLGFTALDHARRHGRASWLAMQAAFDEILTAHLHKVGPEQAVRTALEQKPLGAETGVELIATAEMSDADLGAAICAPDRDIDDFLLLRRTLMKSSAPAVLLQQTDRKGETPLRRIVRLAEPLMLRTLLENGARIDETDTLGNTALLDCALRKDWVSAELCLVCHAEVDHRNLAGETAMMLAARVGALSMFNLLVCNGANWRLTDLAGKNALDHALESVIGGDDSRYIASMIGQLGRFDRGEKIEKVEKVIQQEKCGPLEQIEQIDHLQKLE